MPINPVPKMAWQETLLIEREDIFRSLIDVCHWRHSLPVTLAVFKDQAHWI